MVVRADTGAVVEDVNLTWGLEDASLNVYTDDSPEPMTPGPDAPVAFLPPEVPREMVLVSGLDTNAFPLGWIPDGTNTLSGNNADVYADRDDDDAPDSPPVEGSHYRVFDQPVDLDEFPSS